MLQMLRQRRKVEEGIVANSQAEFENKADLQCIGREESIDCK